MLREETLRKLRTANEEKKKQMHQEYANQFRQIVSSVSDSTNKVLQHLANYGYSIKNILWVGELHAPSLTDKSAVSFSITKKE